MQLSYLRVEPPVAVRILEECLNEGYQLKDTLEHDYFVTQKEHVTQEKMKAWRQKTSDWTNTTLQKLAGVFLNQRQQYNFRDAPIPITRRSGVSADYDNLIHVLQGELMCWMDI